MDFASTRPRPNHRSGSRAAKRRCRGSSAPVSPPAPPWSSAPSSPASACAAWSRPRPAVAPMLLPGWSSAAGNLALWRELYQHRRRPAPRAAHSSLIAVVVAALARSCCAHRLGAPDEAALARRPHRRRRGAALHADLRRRHRHGHARQRRCRPTRARCATSSPGPSSPTCSSSSPCRRSSSSSFRCSDRRWRPQLCAERRLLRRCDRAARGRELRDLQPCSLRWCATTCTCATSPTRSPASRRRRR